MPFFPDRIRQSGIRESAYQALDRQQADALVAVAMSVVLRQSRHEVGETFSIADLEPAALEAKLMSLGIQDQTVFICWPAFHEALRIEWTVLASHFDDFWYPSSDDVLVTPSDESWVLEVTHEEVAHFLRTKPI